MNVLITLLQEEKIGQVRELEGEKKELEVHIKDLNQQIANLQAMLGRVPPANADRFG